MKKTISTTDNPFSDKQIEDAMAVIETEFKTHASKGDQLLKITYDKNLSATEIERYVLNSPQKNANELLVLSSSFKTGKYGASFNPNSDYHDFLWIVTKAKNDTWLILDKGY